MEYDQELIYKEYEIINASKPQPINFRNIKLTWNEYFKKIYNISLIILVSAIIYIYYIYTKTNKQNKTNTNIIIIN